MMNEWKKFKLGDVIDFNPRESISKGQVAKKVAMEKLIPFSKFIDGYELVEFKGGSKFRNGDTLLARITPCLENGKTAKVTILDDDEVGYGSTEYIVMREKLDRTANDFIYYLSISPRYRDIAIKSMVGTSGRQRVQHDVLENVMIAVPPLNEQKAIAATLSSLDDKIELNNKINKILEEMAQSIFKSWFVDLEPFQDGEFEESELGRIPKGWKVIELGECVTIIDNRGKTPPLSSKPTPYPIIDVKALSGQSRIINYDKCTKYVNEDTYKNWFRNGHPLPQDILMSTVGSLAEMKLFYGNKGCIAQNVVGFRIINIFSQYLYQYLKHIKADLVSYNIGSVQPSIKVTHIIKLKILIPSDNVLTGFESTVKKISEVIFKNHIENQILANIRNEILPKLMSGEIRVPIEEVR